MGELLLFCPCQKDKINSRSPHLAARGVVSGHFSLTTDYLFVDLVWFLDYALLQDFLFSSFLKHP